MNDEVLLCDELIECNEEAETEEERVLRTGEMRGETIEELNNEQTRTHMITHHLHFNNLTNNTCDRQFVDCLHISFLFPFMFNTL